MQMFSVQRTDVLLMLYSADAEFVSFPSFEYDLKPGTGVADMPAFKHAKKNSRLFLVVSCQVQQELLGTLKKSSNVQVSWVSA